MPKAEAFLHGFYVLSAAGAGLDALALAMRTGLSPGMKAGARFSPAGQAFPVGEVEHPLADPPGLEPDFDSRNNRMAWTAVQPLRAALEDALARHGAARVAVVVGTSTSGMLEAERAFARRASGRGLGPDFRYHQQELGAPAAFLARALDLGGPALTVSTACSSSAKALATARRLLRLDACDAVLCGGVDTLCRFTVHGFAALGALSEERCNPFSRNRHGINIGEAAAFCLVTRREGPARLAGCGDANDAYNVSAPLPGGEGAEAAMRMALKDAGLAPAQVGYLNLHGTGTVQNDSMEAAATARVFPEGLPCSSTKPLTGHALGASGALEAALCWDLLAGRAAEQGLPPHYFDGETDSALPPLALVRRVERHSGLRRVMTNSFGFGGSNVSLVLEKP
ncbi:MAG TPA: beta-ketoacyl-ACP synthase [bacterium]|jgi:3-oxoacyl-[acyl-carrier-protein] synthase-1|nr:beta-ketoacyl-ACP synthase [bacterium]